MLKEVLRLYPPAWMLARYAEADDYRTGAPGSRLAILSTYLGHTDPGGTYWYLSAAPELLGLAGDRLDSHVRGDV